MQLCRAKSLQLRHVSTIGKKHVKQQYLHMSSQYGELRPTSDISVYQFGAPLQISTGFASWQRYCSDVVHWRPTKLCTMFGRLLGCYIIYFVRGLLSSNGISPSAKFTLRPSLAFSCIGMQRYCTAVQQWASAKLCGVVQGMELRNFRRGRHLYSAGRPSRWAPAHILVLIFCTAS